MYPASAAVLWQVVGSRHKPAAHGKTIFWKYNADYLKATGGKSYR